MRINSNKIKEMIENSSNVIIVAHKNLDLDALGSCLGINYICSNLDKTSYILIEDLEFEQGVKRALNKIKELEYGVDIRNIENLRNIINKNSLLIIVDTNRKKLIQNTVVSELINTKILIDHHIKDKNLISDIDYEYVNPEESSTCEIIIDIINDLNLYIPKYISTVMLAGIVVDTNNFYLKTTDGTYDAASTLNKFGADMTELQYLLKQDFNEYIQRQLIIINTDFINNNIAVAMGDFDKIYEKQDLAKVADTILLFNEIEACFVIGNISDNEVGISARSLGNIDVQKIMQKLNGGGHKTDSATQLKDVNLEETKKLLLKLLD